MRGSAARRYGVWSGAIALLVGSALVALALPHGARALRWCMIGWSIMAVTGCCGGTWTASRLGSAGPGFFVALGSCMLARLVAGAAAALGAAAGGMESVWALLAGLGLTFLPLQLFEVGWFLRQSRSGMSTARWMES